MTFSLDGYDIDVTERINGDRQRRLSELENRYIIIFKSRKGEMLYIQREEFTRNGKYNWSRYKSNAKPFKTENSALE